jgi:diketogulonate reductase-like aldo/keto reductase
MAEDSLTRRGFLKGVAATVGAAMLRPRQLFAQSNEDESNLIKKPIPSTGEHIPVIGMGTWQTFNVGGDEKLKNARADVLRHFFKNGGSLIDSSPMYGSSQDAIGYGLEKIGMEDRVFSADKVWTSDGDETRAQTKASRKKWNVEFFDLMQIHNLLSWEQHLPTLQEMKKQGKLRYVGITTSHGRRHGDLADILSNEDLDFVQLTYNLANRRVEERLLPLARENGVAVIANRPFRQGGLVDRFQDQEAPLPEWADEFDIHNWPQFLLKFIVSHPAVTCAIPATTQVEHMEENMGAARGKLPDEKARAKMLEYAAKF